MTVRLQKEYTNLVKLFAAIFVAICHYSVTFQYVNNWPERPFLDILEYGGFIGVSIFFFFSGYGLMESEQKHHLGFRDFIVKRILKIYLPVLAVTCIWTPLYYLFVENSEANITFTGVIADILWGFNDGVLWFVKSLLILYVFFYLFSNLSRHEHIVPAHLCLVCGMGICMYLSYLWKFPLYHIIPFFVVGVYTSLFKTKCVAGIPLCYLLLLGLFIAYLSLRANLDCLHASLCCIIIAVIITLSNFPQPEIKMPAFIVSAIFVIYIVHNKVIYLMVALTGEIHFIPWMLITVTATIVITALLRLIRFLK